LLCAGEAVEWLPPLLHAVANRAMTAATARPAYRRACRDDLRSVPRTVTPPLPVLRTWTHFTCAVPTENPFAYSDA
jgi:hypothetical protein